MRRRDFINVVTGSAVTWPLAARAQQTRLPIIGFVGADAISWSPWKTAFVQRLQELGWTEGRTVTIEYRWNEGQPERISEIAAEFIRLKVEVIVTNAIAVATLKQATTVIPIVFAIAPDPVGGGLVASLARPGGNVTGQSVQSVDLASKRLEFFREMIPHLRRLAILFNADFSQSVAEAHDVKATAVSSVSKSRHSRSATRQMLLPPLRRSYLRLTRSMSLLTRSFPPAAAASLPLHLAGDYRRPSTRAIMSKRVDSFPMGQISQPYSGTPLIMWTRFCAGPSLAISPSSSLLNLISSSISPLREHSG